MPQEDFDAVIEFTEDLYLRLIEYIDWPRIMLEAQGRCAAYEHDHGHREAPCAESVERALLVYERPMFGHGKGYGGWHEADADVEARRVNQPLRYHMPKDLSVMFAAWCRAVRKSKRRALAEEP